ncbi:hypothetical protein FJZ19_01755 [Candidatus Pacearchaeota archaeon]|nr:hypothetical protein [Candidatus Pacearchaeota archaeon]
MNKTKLLLVYPEVECSVTSAHTYSLPLGLGAIATYCKEKFGDSLDIKILDGSLLNHEEQLRETKRFCPNITGVNPTIASQRKAYEIARLAKDLGSFVVFGGVHSSATWDNGKEGMWINMLTNRDFIDGVVLHEGEIPMFVIINRLRERGVLEDTCFEGIPNFAFKDNGGKIHKPSLIHVPHLNNLPDIDYSLFDLKRFFEQTESRGFGKAVTYYAGKGCAKRGGRDLKRFYTFDEYNALVASMDICTFCGRNELGFRNMEEDREAKVLRELHDRYGARGFFNVQDTINLGHTFPLGLNDSWFRLFIGTESITPENIARLKQRYGPNLIFQAGVESATPEMRNVFGKTEIDAGSLTQRVELMRDEGVQLHASFILGGRGETKDSMRRTTESARRLAEYNNVTWILISPQLILPGSPDYKAFLQMPKMYRRYAKEDLIDIPRINQDFLGQFSPSLRRGDVLEEIRQTFEDIGTERKDVILDVKGVVGDEESYIKPNRPYAS